MKKVSFIIIAYNEEKNIKNAIESILNQKCLGNYEIIVVNDASLDKTKNIVQEIKKKNKNIKLVNLKVNGGRGNARQTGVKKSDGDYISFIDADIILPKNWLQTCLKEIETFDAVGGIPVPDGDVAYIYQRFKLKPKVKRPTTEITGSNCLYRKKLLEHIQFDPSAKDGEDFDINEKLKKKGYKLKTLNIVVRHNELRSFKSTFKWIYQIGIGSMRLLKKYRRIRLADWAFFGFFAIFIASILELSFFGNANLLLGLIIYIFLTSSLHIISKFYLTKKQRLDYFAAIFFNIPFMIAYYSGKLRGLIKYEK